MDGLTQCGHLNELCPSMTAMMVTGSLGSGFEEEAHAAGAQRVMLKPVDVGTLLAFVEQALPATNCKEGNRQKGCDR